MTTSDLMRAGSVLFLGAVDRLDEDTASQRSSLPTWTRKHVIAHVHHNAEALRRLVSWARTGRENRMYASLDERDDEIARSGGLDYKELRAQVHASNEALLAELDDLSEVQWRRQVLTAQGRTVPATEIPWLRAREVSVHAVDLAAGVVFADLPDEFNAALAAEVVSKRCASGEAAVVAQWLTGRGATATGLRPWP